MTNRITVKIGNSRTTCALFRDEKLIESWHYATDEIDNVATQLIKQSQEQPGLELAVCSVVPKAEVILQKYFKDSNVKNFAVTYSSQNLIHGAYESLGADRVASACAALAQHPNKEVILVFDFGTATTLTVIDGSGRFLGGLITLGLGKTFDGLHQFTAQLPDLKQSLGSGNLEGLGDDTPSSIIAGCLLGHLGLLEKWRNWSQAHFAGNSVVVATGGYTRYLTGYTNLIDFVEPNLTSIGINLIAQKAEVLKDQA